MNTQPRSLPAVSSQSRRYQYATPTQLCVFFAGIDVVFSCFWLVYAQLRDSSAAYLRYPKHSCG